jgi:hypothetical protein
MASDTAAGPAGGLASVLHASGPIDSRRAELSLFGSSLARGTSAGVGRHLRVNPRRPTANCTSASYSADAQSRTCGSFPVAANQVRGNPRWRFTGRRSDSSTTPSEPGDQPGSNPSTGWCGDSSAAPRPTASSCSVLKTTLRCGGDSQRSHPTRLSGQPSPPTMLAKPGPRMNGLWRPGSQEPGRKPPHIMPTASDEIAQAHPITLTAAIYH